MNSTFSLTWVAHSCTILSASLCIVQATYVIAFDYHCLVIEQSGISPANAIGGERVGSYTNDRDVDKHVTVPEFGSAF
jgi:hypothetical protein